MEDLDVERKIISEK